MKIIATWYTGNLKSGQQAGIYSTNYAGNNVKSLKVSVEAILKSFGLTI